MGEDGPAALVLVADLHVGKLDRDEPLGWIDQLEHGEVAARRPRGCRRTSRRRRGGRRKLWSRPLDRVEQGQDESGRVDDDPAGIGVVGNRVLVARSSDRASLMRSGVAAVLRNAFGSKPPSLPGVLSATRILRVVLAPRHHDAAMLGPAAAVAVASCFWKASRRSRCFGSSARGRRQAEEQGDDSTHANHDRLQLYQLWLASRRPATAS